MQDLPIQKLIEVLQDINTNQQQQLKKQDEILALQHENLELAKRQFQRAEKLQERAEKLQHTSAGMVQAARKAMVVIMPVIFGLLVYLTWLLFR